jgi:hypothetical protein
LDRITIPLLNRRVSPIPTDESAFEDQEVTAPAEKQPKYITPEKLLPPLPPNEESGTLIEEAVVGRDIFNGWLKGPEDDMRSKKNKGKNKRHRESSQGNGKSLRSSRAPDRDSLTGTTEDHDGINAIPSRDQKREGDPQGFIYGKFKLDKNMIVTLCWEGLSVEVSPFQHE